MLLLCFCEERAVHKKVIILQARGRRSFKSGGSVL